MIKTPRNHLATSVSIDTLINTRPELHRTPNMSHQAYVESDGAGKRYPLIAKAWFIPKVSANVE